MSQPRIADPLRSQYRELTDDEQQVVATIKMIGGAFLEALKTARAVSDAPREFDLAQTRLEEAVMWAVKGVTG